MKQKIFYLDVHSTNGIPTPDSQRKLDKELESGWCIKTTTSQMVSVASTQYSKLLYGGFLLVLEKKILLEKEN